MVTKVKVDYDTEISDLMMVNSDFYYEFDVEVLDLMLVEVSPCNKYEYLYLFMGDDMVSFFINSLLDYNIAVYEKDDFTITFKKIIKDNKIDEFKSKLSDIYTFDSLLNKFYSESIDIDDVLDKISYSGLESLSEYDYSVLNDNH